MATQTIYTRVKNKVDSLAKWQASTTPLLAGEIAIVRVATGASYENPVTGKNEPVVELLMKVGDGTTAFGSLPWLSAKASDVYNWAKKPTAAEVPVKIITGTGESAVETSMTLGDIVQNVNENLADVSALKNAVDVEKVSTAISSAIAALDSTHSGTGNFVKSVVQTDGRVAVTYGNIAEADLPEISASKIIVTPASGDVAEVTLAAKLSEIDGKLAEYDGALTGGVHFIGEVTSPADLSTALSSKKVTVNGKEYTATDGDVVIQGSKEYIWVGSAWKELGDLTRVGALETWRQTLTVTDAAVDSKFVTAVSQADGKIVVSREQPTSADVVHSGETLASYLADHVGGLETKVDIADGSTVTETIAAKINALDFSAPTASGTATAFISSVSQADGKITATKANLPTASASVAGIVKLGTAGGAAPYSVVADISAVEANYLRFNTADEKLYLGKDGTDEIIFDCGGAPV
jgi:hypothetical protein